MRPRVDLTALPDDLAAEEFRFRADRAAKNPQLAVDVVFRLRARAKQMVYERQDDCWAVAT